MSTKSELIVLAQSLEQPRIIKRVIEKSQDYDRIELFGFTRQIHTVNNYALLQDYPNIHLSKLASLSDKKYLGRIKSYFDLIKLVLKRFGLKSKEIYVFGLDLRIISAFIPKATIYYEISDIVWLYKAKSTRFILSQIDKLLAKKSEKVIFTSKGFYNGYYKGIIDASQVEFKENKFKSYNKVSPVQTMLRDRIRLAYIGAFRYSNIIERLLEIVADNPEITLNFYGDGKAGIVNTMKKYAENFENITFNGAFKNPDDLERIYADNNLNFVVYENALENERVAMPNKFYESGFFNIPIVCANNTYVGQRVEELKMGWSIGTEKEDIDSFLKKLQLKDLVEVHERIKQLDKSLFHC